MPQTKDVSTSSAGTLTVPALTAPLGTSVGLAPALPPGATVSRGVAQTLQQLVEAHNAVHGNDRKKRADIRALRAAYRRGAGRKPRPGRSRRQEGLARAQAHLAALAGKELPAEYAADRELLPGEEKRLAVLTLEGTAAEPQLHLKALGVAGPPAHTDAVPEPEQKDAPPAVESKTWSDEARAAALAARRANATSLPRSKRSTTLLPNGPAKHADGSYGRVEHVTVSNLRPGDQLIHPTTGEKLGTVTDVRWGEGFGKTVDDKTPLGADRQVHVDGEPRGVQAMGARYARFAPETEPTAGDVPLKDSSAIAHNATQAVLDAPATGEARMAAHENARDAHLAAASAHKLAGNEKEALEHLSLADHHRNSAEAYRDDAAEHHYPVGSRVAAPNGKEGEVVAHAANGTAVRHDDGSLAVHKTSALLPGSDNTLRGTVAARDAKPGDFVWDSSHPEGGYRVQTHEVTGSGADETVHHTFADSPLGTGHRYHRADSQLRVVRGSDASRYDRHT